MFFIFYKNQYENADASFTIIIINKNIKRKKKEKITVKRIKSLKIE